MCKKWDWDVKLGKAETLLRDRGGNRAGRELVLFSNSALKGWKFPEIKQYSWVHCVVGQLFWAAVCPLCSFWRSPVALYFIPA